MRKSFVFLLLVFLLCPSLLRAGNKKAVADAAGQQNFVAGNGAFLLNGKPFVVKAAELHYPRIPRPYWEQRIQLCKALGMNTICLYTFWNAHEPEPGKFDFQGKTTCASSLSSVPRTT